MGAGRRHHRSLPLHRHLGLDRRAVAGDLGAGDFHEMTLVRKSRLIIAWLLGAWFCHLYVPMGWAKFDPASFWTALFAHWGFPPSFRILIGAIEVTAGVA